MPFRLVGIFPREKRIAEWRCKPRSMEVQQHTWKSRATSFRASRSHMPERLGHGRCRFVAVAAAAPRLACQRAGTVQPLRASPECANAQFHRTSLQTRKSGVPLFRWQSLCNAGTGGPVWDGPLPRSIFATTLTLISRPSIAARPALEDVVAGRARTPFLH